MKKQFTLFLFPVLLLISLSTLAQDIQKGAPGMWPAVIRYTAAAPAFKSSSISMLDDNRVPVSLRNGKISKMESDNAGMKHYRYQQYYNGIPVENAVLVAHIKLGKISSQNGKWIKDYPQDLPATAAISVSRALDLAKKEIGARMYKWEIPGEEALLKKNNPSASYLPKGELVYYSGEQDVVPSALRLAWKFDIYAQEPISRQLVFVDAQSGKILGKRELIHETNAPGTAVTAYSGTQNIMADYTGAAYRLRETGRGNGINTYNLQKGTSYAAAVDFTDADNNWNNVNANQDEYATDAHWGAEMTYDYFFTKFNRNSIDNAGYALNSYIHYGTAYFNAFWDGYKMTYGDGDAAHGNKPLTSLDVCGHEITHGLTTNTSNLVYSYESGALNEGFSDIFGTAIEAFARPSNNDWLLGGDFYTIRSMSNPNAYNQPDTYLGTNWYTGTGDNGGVHINSGVLNYWFYLLTMGGSGTNDHGVVYNVTGIGMDKAAAIAYRLNTFYLISTSEFFDARILGIQAAEDLYGIGSNEAIQTANAWTAVGLYGVSCGAVTGMNVSPLQDVTATLNWDAMPGANYYKVQYKPASSSNWINAGTVTGTSVSLSGLTATTLYDWRIRASCNNAYTSAQFTTAAPVCNPPGGLNALATGTEAELTWAAAPYAQNYVLEYKLASNNIWTVLTTTTQRIYTLTGLSLATTYDWRVKTNCSFGVSNYGTAQFTTGSTACNAPTGISYNYTNNESNFTWNAVPGATGYIIDLDWAGAPWPGQYSQSTNTNSISISNLMQSGPFQIRVRTDCGGSSSLWSSTFLFTTPCSAPVSQSTTNITTNSATFNWVPAPGNTNNTAHSAAYRLANTNNAWTTLPNTTGTSANVSGLMPGMVYEWKVTKICSYFNSSSITTQFTTLGQPCTAPTGLNSSGISGTQATVSWTPVSGAVSYNVQYKPSTSSTWIASTTSSATSRVLTGLTESTVYDWRVMTNCSANYSPYSSAQFITSTASGCAVPTGLNAININNTTATINWTAVSGASSYNIYYKLASSNTWNSVNSNTTSYNLTNLQMNGQYQFQVRSKCGSTYSAFSLMGNFTTLSCASWGNNSSQWIDLFSLGTISRVSGADPGGYINTGLTTNLVIGSTTNAGVISMGFNGSVQKHNFCIYIDTNRNNIFEDNERFAGASLINTSGNVNFNLVIPASVTPGLTKMRVVVRKNTDGPVYPCLTGFLGETEDYQVNLVTAAPFTFGSGSIFKTEIAVVKAKPSASPNPSEGRFSIHVPGDFIPVQYGVFNNNGVSVLNGKPATAKPFTIDLTHLPNGIYLLRLVDANGKNEVMKLVKN